ncbi:hypothetical protein V6N11_002947 [Hibiscus sabdariffa]|uniref:Uncharacterized protein n=1 Tax=Hibiscus sabdariffa TaxID=183260 RepID=A0ABR2SCE2_9ROSI
MLFLSVSLSSTHRLHSRAGWIDGRIRFEASEAGVFGPNRNIRCIPVECLFQFDSVLSGGWLQDQQGQNIVPMKLSGDIKVNLHFLHITLPKIKVALDCDMNFEHRDLEFLNEVYNKKAAKDLYASFFNGSKSFLKKCALAIYI